MTEDDPTDEISDIEAQIEALAAIAERCRKYILASKIAIGGGAALLLITIYLLRGGSTRDTDTINRISVLMGSKIAGVKFQSGL